MISPEQHRALASLLVAKLPAGVTGATISTYVPEAAMARPPATDNLALVASWIIEKVLEWRKPDYFVALVWRVDSGLGGVESLLDLARRLSNDPSLWVPLGGALQGWSLDNDPPRIVDGRPFLDRSGFRKLLPRLDGTATPACLLVSGARSEGKSYLADFCAAFARARGEDVMKVGCARILDDATKVGHLRELAVALALDLGVPGDGDLTPPEHEDPHRDAENLANWIADNVPNQRVPSLAILDHFGRDGVGKDYHKFVSVLVRRVEDDPEVQGRLRAVLIDYDPSVLADAGLKPTAYILEPIDAELIAEWFRRQFPQHPPSRYEAAGLRIAQEVSKKEPTKQMYHLNNRVRAVSEMFRRV